MAASVSGPATRALLTLARPRAGTASAIFRDDVSMVSPHGSRMNAGYKLPFTAKLRLRSKCCRIHETAPAGCAIVVFRDRRALRGNAHHRPGVLQPRSLAMASSDLFRSDRMYAGLKLHRASATGAVAIMIGALFAGS